MIWVTLTALPPNRALFATAAASMRIPVAAGTVATRKTPPCTTLAMKRFGILWEDDAISR
jgi:hypothetical protein